MYGTGDAIDIWVVERALGQGGMGSVYRCHNRDAKRILGAIKVLDFGLKRSPKARARFVREAEILFSLSHPNIVKVRNVRLDCDPPYLEMEFVEGMSLERRLVPGAMSPSEAISIFGQLAGALSYLHARGIRHRDVKPSNILLGSNNVATLVDFGIATEEDGTTLSEAGQAMGSVSYVPPEWARLEQVDAVKWDIYALGVCLFESLSGNNAFAIPDGGMTTQRFYQVLHAKQGHAPLDPGAHIPASLRELVAEMTHSDPDLRMATADAVRARLSAIDPEDTRFEAAPVASARMGGATMVPDAFGLGPNGAANPGSGASEGGKATFEAPTLAQSESRASSARRNGLPEGTPVGALAAVGVLAMVLAAAGVWWAFGEGEAARTPAGAAVEADAPQVPGNPTLTAAPPAAGSSPTEASSQPTSPPELTPPDRTAVEASRPAAGPTTGKVSGGSGQPSPSAVPASNRGTPPAVPPINPATGSSAAAADAVILPAAKSAGKPVTGAQLAAFLAGHPEWQRESMPGAGDKYLKGWVGATPPDGAESAPAVSVSWNLAKAYCATRGGLADVHAAPASWEESPAQPWMEYRQDNGSPVWRRDDGGTSPKLDPSAAGAFIGFRCAK